MLICPAENPPCDCVICRVRVMQIMIDAAFRQLTIKRMRRLASIHPLEPAVELLFRIARRIEPLVNNYAQN